MRILVDGDACPNKKEIADLAKKYQKHMIVYGDYAHQFNNVDYEVKQTDVGADHVDMMIMNDVMKGDLVITQDYGLASLLLPKQAIVLHVSGMIIDENRIEQLLMTRYISLKERKAKHRIKGPSVRTKEDVEYFLKQLESILKQQPH